MIGRITIRKPDDWHLVPPVDAERRHITQERISWTHCLDV
jgi:hypothetical protein